MTPEPLFSPVLQHRLTLLLRVCQWLTTLLILALSLLLLPGRHFILWSVSLLTCLLLIWSLEEGKAALYD